MPQENESRGMIPARVMIAEAAIRVIAQQGFDVVSVRTVAQESGISPGTVWAAPFIRSGRSVSRRFRFDGC
uniref:TetR family transcriptional regulator n=1 Tax=Kocuria marina TaxID=223184 RepID=UPI0011A36846